MKRRLPLSGTFHTAAGAFKEHAHWRLLTLRTAFGLRVKRSRAAGLSTVTFLDKKPSGKTTMKQTGPGAQTTGNETKATIMKQTQKHTALKLSTQLAETLAGSESERTQ